jgi:hypothetical protein
VVRVDWFDVFLKFSEVGKHPLVGKGKHYIIKSLNRNILILLITLMG